MNDQLEALEYLKMESFVYWIAQVYGLVPQPVKPQFMARFSIGLLMQGKDWDKFCKSVRKEWFEDYKEGLHLTWQQSLIAYGVDKAMKGEVPLRISIVSGHGIGKSMILSLIILWFLFIHPDSQVACTSPGAAQMYDILWKELKKWIEKMDPGMAKLYIWEASHIRMSESPNVWFARAKTASKENTEALAGVHADWVLMAVDEASGVDELIFETMEGALTSGNVLVFLISNGTQSIGYFYDTHHKSSAMWQNFSFSSLDSPRVDQKYVDGIIAQYGEDSVQYTIRVKGEFPDEGIMDDKGYVQLFNEDDIKLVPFDNDWVPVGRAIGALDASGEGQDKSAWAIRDRQRLGIVATEDKSTPGGMAIKSLTICDKYKVDPIDFVIDAFGKGQDVGMEIALATAKFKSPWRVYPVNTGDACEDPTDQILYMNKRAEGYYKMMKWCRAGGSIMTTPRIKMQLMSIRFRRTANGRIQIMDKVQMKKLGFPSPDEADAASMTFLRPDYPKMSPFEAERKERQKEEFDPANTVGE